MRHHERLAHLPGAFDEQDILVRPRIGNMDCRPSASARCVARRLLDFLVLRD
jgi:hypothetical protein